MTRLEPPRGIVITGASSGLGAALARAYAAPGAALGLIARNRERLDEVAAACRERGAQVETGLLDVAEGPPLADWLLRFDRSWPVELVVASAGISAGTRPDGTPEGAALATAQVRINLLGAMHTIEPLLPAMRARGVGRIAVVSSIAGLRGLPDSPGYSASKAGVRAYGEALRAHLRPSGIRVSVVCPGFFDSPMTDRFIGSHPFMLSLPAAADIVKRGLDCGRPRIVFPGLLALGLRLADLAPARLGDFLVGRFHFRIAPRGDT
jgi:short-subunit dehydrogenase